METISLQEAELFAYGIIETVRVAKEKGVEKIVRFLIPTTVTSHEYIALHAPLPIVERQTSHISALMDIGHGVKLTQDEVSKFKELKVHQKRMELIYSKTNHGWTTDDMYDMFSTILPGVYSKEKKTRRDFMKQMAPIAKRIAEATGIKVGNQQYFGKKDWTEVGKDRKTKFKPAHDPRNIPGYNGALAEEDFIN